MSVIAPSISATSSILKTRSIRFKTTQQHVRFQLPENVEEVLHNYTVSKSIKPYEELILAIRDEKHIQDEQLLKLLKEVRGCISYLDMTVHHFVDAVLMLNWAYRGDEVVTEFQELLVDLMSAHNYYTKTVLQNLMNRLKSGENEKEWVDGMPSEKEEIAFNHVHEVLKILLQVVPMSCDILVQCISKCFPYHGRPAHEQECYIYNILKIIEYQPHLSNEILFFILKRLILLDVNASRSEVLEQEEENDDDVEDMDIDEAETMFSMESNEINGSTQLQCKMKHPVANCLDIAMRQMFMYIKSECHNSNNQIDWDRTKSLYYDIIKVFDEVVLTTHATYHIQFLVFYLISFKMQLVEGFLSFLWRKVINPNVAPVIRQSAITYIGSLLSRASYINISMLKTSLAEISTWIHKYIASQDGLECANSDVRVHAVFYSVCQSLFYIIAFRYRDLVSGKKNLTFLQNLNLTKVVTCKLNPLKVCLPVVAQNFAAVTRTYQLAYCYAVMEHNSRNTLPVLHQDYKGGYYMKDSNWLESFFPFDPFVLMRCFPFIEPIYSIYHDTEKDAQIVTLRKSEDVEDEDDFLVENSQGNISTFSDMFSYSSSPGFKRL